MRNGKCLVSALLALACSACGNEWQELQATLEKNGCKLVPVYYAYREDSKRTLRKGEMWECDGKLLEERLALGYARELRGEFDYGIGKALAAQHSIKEQK
jgi:hypothetical protein